MLRIEKTGEDNGIVSLKLEGRLVAQWAVVVEEECLRVLRGQKRLILDFAGVTFIDRAGVAMLREVTNERVRLVNCSPLVKELLGETQRA